jgi:hypothetical protein
VIPHWDIAVREVAAESMAIIAVLDLDYACSDIIPALVRRGFGVCVLPTLDKRECPDISPVILIFGLVS